MRFMKRLQDNNILELYSESELNAYDTEQKGEKIYDKVLYAKLIPPGGGNQEAIHEIKREFGNPARGVRITKKVYDPNTKLTLWSLVENHAKEFEKNGTSVVDGIPIEDVSFIHPSIYGTLKNRNIFTIETLAAVPDSDLSGLGMGGRELRDKAKYYLDAQKSNAPMLAVAAEKAEREKEIDALKKQVSALTAAVSKEPKALKEKDKML